MYKITRALRRIPAVLASLVFTASVMGASVPVFAADTANISVQPTAASIATGNTVSVKVSVGTGNVAASGVVVDLTFDANVVTYQSYNTMGSPFEVDPVQSINGSTFHLEAVTLGAGQAPNSSATVATVVFKGKAAGTSALTLTDTSKVFTSGGSEITGTRSSSSVQVTSAPNPNPDVDTTGPINTGVTARYDKEVDAVIVNWQTNEKAVGKVNFGLDNSLGYREVEFTPNDRNHNVRWKSDLIKPGRVVYYRVISIDTSDNDTRDPIRTITIPGGGTAVLSVHVGGADKAPLAGATVTYDGGSQSGTTDNNGNVTFNVLRDGNIPVTVKYKDDPVSTEVANVSTSGGNQTLAIQYEKPSNIVAKASDTRRAATVVGVILGALILIGIIMFIVRKLKGSGPPTSTPKSGAGDGDMPTTGPQPHTDTWAGIRPKRKSRS